MCSVTWEAHLHSRKEVGSSHDACLREPESALKALLKKKASAEVAKKKLFDCALAIKKAKRLQGEDS